MTSNQSSAHYIFWLARYAHNTLAPILNQAKVIEPSIQFQIDMTFADAESVHSWAPHISVSSHWSRDGMFQMSSWLESKADIDRFAAKVAGDVAILQPVETGIAA